MNRFAAGLVFFLGLFSASTPVFAQQGLQSPAGTPTVVVAGDAATTRERLWELLRQHPPVVAEILRRDPTLANPQYLEPYPALVAFLQQHPEIARSPTYFFGGFTFQVPVPRDRAQDMFEIVMAGLGLTLLGAAILATFIWTVKSIVDQRRWLKQTRTQAEVHGKLLDRLTNNEDLLAYIQTSAGRKFLESAPIAVDTERAPNSAPLSRILWSMQAGVVLACLGIGFWIAQSRFPDDMGEGFFIIGTLVAALGIGFAISAGLAYVICADVAAVASLLREDREIARHDVQVPAAGQVWWRAAVRARLDGAHAAARPLTWAQGIAGASAVGVAVGVIGIAWPTIDSAAGWLGSRAWSVGPAALAMIDFVSAAVRHSLPFAIAAAAGIVLAPLALYLALSDD
jgi:hypothetical protein